MWRESELYDERERAALDDAEAATHREDIADDRWEALCEQLPDGAELGGLVAQVALINALNPLRRSATDDASARLKRGGGAGKRRSWADPTTRAAVGSA